MILELDTSGILPTLAVVALVLGGIAAGYVAGRHHEASQGVPADPPAARPPEADAASAFTPYEPGPRDCTVDVDIISRIESNNDDAAIGAHGERGRHQMTAGAWRDVCDYMDRLNRKEVAGWDSSAIEDLRKNYSTLAIRWGVSTVMAHLYINHVIPGYLTRRASLRASPQYPDAVTEPVPDSRIARVAAYNCGAYRVRKAYGEAARGGFPARWMLCLPRTTQEYIQRYMVAAAQAEGKETK